MHLNDNTIQDILEEEEKVQRLVTEGKNEINEDKVLNKLAAQDHLQQIESTTTALSTSSKLKQKRAAKPKPNPKLAPPPAEKLYYNIITFQRYGFDSQCFASNNLCNTLLAEKCSSYRIS